MTGLISVAAQVFLLIWAGMTAITVWGQDQEPKRDRPSAVVPMPAPGAMVGAERFVQLMRKSMGGPAGQDAAAGDPLFSLAGPRLDSAFWSNPEAAGRTLLLQGELMVEMGQVLIRQGQALLAEKPPPVADVPPKTQ